MGHAADCGAHHGSDEQTGAENAARVAGGITNGSGNDLEDCKEDNHLDDDVAVENFLHAVVADAENFRNEVAEKADS